METETVTITTILDSVGTVFEAAITWVGSVATTVVNEPILLLFAVIPLVGLGVGMFKRLINVN